MQTLPDQAVGAVIAAVIAGLIAFLSLLVSKENKTSEFRQNWIDALRNDLAEIMSRANVIADAYAAGVAKVDKETWEAIREDWIAANSAMIRIKLRLNPEEKRSRTLIRLIDELDEGLVRDGEANYELIRSVEAELVSEAHVLLKGEWKRVKRGEPVFAFVKYGSGIALLFAAVIGVYRWFAGFPVLI